MCLFQALSVILSHELTFLLNLKIKNVSEPLLLQIINASIQYQRLNFPFVIVYIAICYIKFYHGPINIRHDCFMTQLILTIILVAYVYLCVHYSSSKCKLYGSALSDFVVFY